MSSGEHSHFTFPPYTRVVTTNSKGITGATRKGNKMEWVQSVCVDCGIIFKEKMIEQK